MGTQVRAHRATLEHRRGFQQKNRVQHGFGSLMLTPQMQADFVAERPDLFQPVAGGWGRMGITHIRLRDADRDILSGALQAAWALRVEKNQSRPKRSTGRTPVPPARRRATVRRAK
jgi:hypothetical protein